MSRRKVNKEKMQGGKFDVWKPMSRMSEKKKTSLRKCKEKEQRHQVMLNLELLKLKKGRAAKGTRSSCIPRATAMRAGELCKGRHLLTKLRTIPTPHPMEHPRKPAPFVAVRKERPTSERTEHKRSYQLPRGKRRAKEEHTAQLT